eukprot:g2975.t1
MPGRRVRIRLAVSVLCTVLLMSGITWKETQAFQALRASQSKGGVSVHPSTAFRNRIASIVGDLPTDNVKITVDGLPPSSGGGPDYMASDRSHDIVVSSTAGGDSPHFSSDSECPLSLDFGHPMPVNLRLCQEYSDSSCCSPQEEFELTNYFTDLQKTILGYKCPGCLENARKLLCAVYCGPAPESITSIKNEGLVAEVNVCQNTCDNFFDSCRDLQTVYHSSDSFCKGAHSRGFPNVGPNNLRVALNLVGSDSTEQCLSIDDISTACEPGVPPKDQERSLEDADEATLVSADPTKSVAGESSDADGGETSDGTWVGIYIGALCVALLLGLLALLTYRKQRAESQKDELIRNLKGCDAVGEYMRIGGNVSASGIYKRVKHGKEKATTWTWVAPLSAKRDEYDDYVSRAHEEEMRLIENASFDTKAILPGPASVILQMRKITNLSKAYKAHIQAYGQIYVGCESSADGVSKAPETVYHANQTSFVRFSPPGVFKHGWSYKSDLEENMLEWESDPKRTKDIDVRFEVKDVREGYVRVVARDRSCNDRFKSFCGFDKEMIGVTERIPLNKSEGEVVTSLEPYFMFDKDDNIMPTMGTKLHVRLDVKQAGFSLESRRGDGYEREYVLPISTSFAGSKWSKTSSTRMKSAPYGAPQLLKELCPVELETRRVGFKMMLVACVKRSEDGLVLQAISDSNKGNCVQLFPLVDDEKSGDGFDSSTCFARTVEMGETTAKVLLCWSTSKGKPMKMPLFVRISNVSGVIGVYEKDEEENSLIGRIKVTADTCKFFAPGKN